MSLLEILSKEASVGDGKGMKIISDALMSRLPPWAIRTQGDWRPLGDSIESTSELSPKYIHQLPSHWLRTAPKDFNFSDTSGLPNKWDE